MWHCYKPLMLVRPNISRDLHVKVLTEPRLAQLGREYFASEP